jgi:MFS family permease
MLNWLLSLNILRGFKYKNYRYYFGGKGITLIGQWMQRTAMSWYIYTLTNDVFWLGFIGFISQVPSFIITPFGGYFADKFPRLKLIKISQSISMLQALTLALLVLSGKAEIWSIIVLSFVLGCIEAFEAPIRHSFVANLVEDKSLVPNAIALNSMMFNGSRLIGPAIAGYLIALLGEGYCFLINGLSHIAVLLALFNMRVVHTPVTITSSGVFANIKEGVIYLYHKKEIFLFIINVIIFTMFGFSYVVLLPVIAKDILGGDAKTLGFIMTMIGCGSLAGSIMLGSRKTTKGLGRQIVYFGFLACIVIALLAFSKQVYITGLLGFLCGLSMMMQMAGANTIIQTLVDEEMRGRVMSLYSLSFLGFTPIGSLLSGSLSKLIGVPNTLVLSASILFVASLFLMKKKIDVV